MDKIWEQLPNETDQQYQAFLLFCEGKTYKQILDITGYKSLGAISGQKGLKQAKDWDNRRAAYETYKAAEGVADSATTITDNTPAEVAENDTGENFNLSEDNQTEETPAPIETATATFTLPVTDTTSPVTLSQRVIKIKFYLNQTSQNILEIGKELTAAKNEVPHGQWQAWLEDNFKLSYRMAAKFMQIAQRFSNVPSKATFSTPFTQTQMIEMLALPAAETEKFIAEKAAEGKPVEDMTVKNLREEIQKYKAANEKLQQEVTAARDDTNKEKARADSLQDKLKTAENETRHFQQEFNDQLTKTQSARQELQDAKKVIAQNNIERTVWQDKIKALEEKPPKVVEVDTEETKKALADSQAQISKLQEQLDAKPAETESLQKEWEQVRAKQADTAKRAVFATLNTISALLATLDDSAKTFIQEYAAEYPDNFAKLAAVANFKTDNGD